MADLALLNDDRDHTEIREDLLRYVKKDDHVFVVLDDDPTGTQTVHDVRVYTDWSYASMKEAFQNEKLFYLLTNSRAMSAKESRRIHEEICAVISRVSKETGKKYFYISRGDSTLRGHYPMETDILAEGLRKDIGHIDGDILIPYFKEGGRFTINDIHYVRYGDRLVPAAETEFAKDKTFGYHSSDLKEYIEEKSEGKIRKEDVISISLDDIRKQLGVKIFGLLCEAKDQKKIIVNAATDDDVRYFCRCLYQAISTDKTFVFRSAASFVKCVGGISDQGLLNKEQMIQEANPNGGIIVVGSHTEKTTRQLNELLKLDGLVPLEFRCSTILESREAFEKEISRLLLKEEEILSSGRTAVIYTERLLISLEDDDKEKALARSVAISDGVCRFISELKIKPSFVLAKGGITSADVAVKGLNIRKAKVLGQIQPGVPVWQAESDSRFPHIPYVIFPGNVGDDETLKNAALRLL